MTPKFDFSNKDQTYTAPNRYDKGSSSQYNAAPPIVRHKRTVSKNFLSETANMSEASKIVKFYPDPLDDGRMVVQLSVGELRSLIREELAALNGHSANTDKENLLTPDDAANLLGVNRRWLYRHADKLPFARRISRKNLRFSEAGLRRWLAAKKPSFPR